MPTTFQIPLDIPNVTILSMKTGDKQEIILTVESTLRTTQCRCCGREINRFHGYDRPIRLQHLPILERVVYLEIQPKRYRCLHCEGKPTTTQTLSWYKANSPHTHALDEWLMKMLMNATVSDASRRCQVSYDAVDGAITRRVSTSVDWSVLKPMATLGLDEIALRKGHKHFVCVVTGLDEQDQVVVLAILPDRLKQTVFDFLDSLPDAFKSAVRRVCSDMYDGFINAASEALPNAEVIIDRFHVAAHYHKGADNLRKTVLKALKQTLDEDAYGDLKGVMWPFRRHFWDLNDEQQQLLSLLLSYSPTLNQAWLLRHELFLIYESDHTPEVADQCFKAWVEKVQQSELTCFDAFITLLDNNRQGILAYFNSRHTSGFVEGMNNKLKVIKRRCFGLLDSGRLFQRIQIDLQERTGFLQSARNTTCCV